MKKIAITLFIIDIIAIVCFVIVYGPFSYARDFWITTAMSTKSHSYLAYIFYNENTIKESLEKNTISNFDVNSDLTAIKIGEVNTNYTSVYEKELLEHNEDEKYKILDFVYNGYNVHLTAVYDPKDVELVSSAYLGSYGQTITDICAMNNGNVCINAGGFVDTAWRGTGGVPTGFVIQDKNVVFAGYGGSGGFIGFTEDNVLLLSNDSIESVINQGMEDAVQFGPFLIVNGVSANTSGNGGYGIQPRTAIAQRRDGVVLFLIVDGNSTGDLNFNGRGGVDMNGLIDILERYGAYNAANMDGGASTSMAVGNNLYNHPVGIGGTGERALPNAWIIK